MVMSLRSKCAVGKAVRAGLALMGAYLNLVHQEEFRQFLRRDEICFDEQYLWD
jgi:hypothetical protein